MAYFSEKRTYFANHQRLHPGPVGSVGDVNINARIKQSYPDMTPAYLTETAGKNGQYFGSNVQNGQHRSWDNKGGPARLIDSNWGGRRNFQTAIGWIHQDLRDPDRRVEPYVGATPGYSWNNRIATCYNAKHHGDKFLPLPGGYALSPGEITRGGAYPQITDVAGGTIEPLTFNQPNAVVAQGPEFNTLNPTNSPKLDPTPLMGSTPRSFR
jgi:hypothetical protein